MSSFIAPTNGAQEASGRISSTLMFAMIGCLLGFAGLVVGFLLVARKSCCAPRRSAVDASLPSYNDSHHHHVHPTGTRRGCPVATLCDLQCPHCLKRGDKSNDRSSRVSLESLESLSPPLPPPSIPLAAHRPPSSRPRGTTSWIPRTGSPTSFGHASAGAATLATPTPAPPPSYYYVPRGPVGGPAPRYRQA